MTAPRHPTIARISLGKHRRGIAFDFAPAQLPGRRKRVSELGRGHLSLDSPLSGPTRPKCSVLVPRLRHFRSFIKQLLPG